MAAEPVRIEVPVPFPIRTVNAWLWPGEDPALVDCAIGTPEGFQVVHDAVQAAGVDPSHLRLYVTHGHVDHAGNAARLHREWDVRLRAPRSESPFIETFRRDSAARNDRYRDAMVLHGMPPADADAMRAGSDDIDAYTEDTPIHDDLPDGASVRLGDHAATAHLAPGHTPGSTVFATEDHHLLSGDTLLETITSNAIELLPEDEGRFHTYVATLESLRRFVGCTVLPGHHAPFPLTEAVLDHHLDKHSRRAARILTQLDRPRSAWDLLPRIFPRLREGQTFLAMSDTVGHLHALEVDERVVRREEGGVRRFVAT